MSEPYPDETWQEFADHQLDHDPTPAQLSLQRLHRAALAAAVSAAGC